MDKNEKAYIGWILENNVDKEFVQRILKPRESPVLDLGDGEVATHKMAWEKQGDGWIAFPTVMMDNGRLKDYGKNAMQQAMMSGNYIQFKTPGEAQWFASNYKKYWELD